jgi:hypothetical protein
MRTFAPRQKIELHTQRAQAPGESLKPSGRKTTSSAIMDLQRTIGNHAVQALFKSTNEVAGETQLTNAPSLPGSERSRALIDILAKSEPDAGNEHRWRVNSKASELPMELPTFDSSITPPKVRLHNDHFAHLIALAHDAEAVTFGSDIYLSAEANTPGLLAHELAHVVQSTRTSGLASRQDREQEAARAQQAYLVGAPMSVQLAGSPMEPMLHPAIRVLLRAGRWLATRRFATISRHVARHGRRIAGRAVHSVFRNPREINALTSRAIREAIPLVRRMATRGADEVIEEGGIRIFRQASRTPGKFRIVVEKTFTREIGTQGERILRLVLDMSGRVVTAFPVDRFLAVGLSMGAVNLFGERTAEAAERTRARIEAEENRPTDWVGELLDFLNPLSGGSLNEGEDLELDIERIIEQTTRDVIQEIETSEQVSLSQEQRGAIAQLVRVGIGNPMALEDTEGE